MAAGIKTGGRQKGTPNKATTRRSAKIVKSGLTPLDYMLTVLRNPRNSQEVRFDAAVKAAPYIHPKLASIQSQVALNGTLSLEQLVAASLPQDLPAETELAQDEDADGEAG